jgi:hypothetical protein
MLPTRYICLICVPAQVHMQPLRPEQVHMPPPSCLAHVDGQELCRQINYAKFIRDSQELVKSAVPIV